MLSALKARENREKRNPTDCSPRITIRFATPADHEAIFRLRHAVYARELQQYPTQSNDQLPDASILTSRFILACDFQEKLLGFVAITPPQARRYGLEKYVPHERWPLPISDRLFEIRALTVAAEHRRGAAASLLMYAALRWIDSQRGARIIAMGRRDLLPLYQKCGLRRSNITFKAGSAEYEILCGSVHRMARNAERRIRMLTRFERVADWRLDIPFRETSCCYHGGAFFQAIGEDFRTLSRRREIINADVLDAWYPPSPRVIAALQEHLPWLLHTSPPTHCTGLVEEIASARGVSDASIVVGGGSSDLMFRALPHWIGPRQRVLILDPMYGEYAHVLEQVIGCQVDRFKLSADRNFRVVYDELARHLRDNRYAACFIVNPNSPTGQLASRAELMDFVRAVPRRTLIWIDETYIDFPGRGHSLETVAASCDNLIVCKSMSKFYALSGARVGYLCGHPRRIGGIRQLTPPWVIGLPSQLAAVEALRDPAYYERCRLSTIENRERLEIGLRNSGLLVVPACANFLLAFIKDHRMTAAELVSACRKTGLYLRDAAAMGSLGNYAVRVAVKDAATCKQMVQTIENVLKM